MNPLSLYPCVFKGVFVMDEDRNYCVYCHTNKVNGKRYIGLTGDKPEIRWRNGANHTYNEYFRRSIQKYGWDNFIHEVLFDNLTFGEACELEKEFIAKYNTTNRELGYNMTSGGEGVSGYHFSEETKKKISKTQKDRFRDKTKCPMYGRCGKLNPRYGTHHSNETKKKIGDGNRGKKVSFETRKRMSEGQLNSKDKKRIKVAQINKITDELIKIYPSIRIASEETGIRENGISAVINGRQKTAGGFKWKPINDD